MSVLACDRVGCDNIMCDRLSHKRQEYLCNECFEELVRLGPDINLNAFMGGEREVLNIDASRVYWGSYFSRIEQ